MFSANEVVCAYTSHPHSHTPTHSGSATLLLSEANRAHGCGCKQCVRQPPISLLSPTLTPDEFWSASDELQDARGNPSKIMALATVLAQPVSVCMCEREY
jgi:hypothetical protein